MQSNLAGRRAVITGGSRGIGLAIADALAAEGAHVSICGRGADTLETAREQLAAHGTTVHAAQCDVADAAAIEGYIDAAASALGGIDILVNNASGFGVGDTEEGWAASINVDLLGSIRATRAARPWLEKSEQGSIIHIASIAGQAASARTAAYGAIKAALIQYTQSQASELAPQRIRVNAIAPGSIDFPGGLWQQRKAANPTLYENTRASIPFGRFGHPEEIANTAVFLASPLASWITGQTVTVDGGQLLR
ncbi:SDR family NAD(P)-dependent oxidoreductase [Salinisphaera aquimarina]|uniref:SDR family NAD(P)-dependent oxidoreductase n=1 Tax=Salinisphaera aquimarina TaxID=2094031 RepID=A0ABV7EPU9_9GAMM